MDQLLVRFESKARPLSKTPGITVYILFGLHGHNIYWERRSQKPMPLNSVEGSFGRNGERPGNPKGWSIYGFCIRNRKHGLRYIPHIGVLGPCGEVTTELCTFPRGLRGLNASNDSRTGSDRPRGSGISTGTLRNVITSSQSCKE